VDRDRVVAGIVHGIGFVVADDEFRVGLERIEHERGESAVAPVGDGDVPGAPLTGQLSLIRVAQRNRLQCRIGTASVLHLPRIRGGK
jgi:hypothetical protein